jgi:MarR family transcriptional regulator, transcriptional regulator for hemolysin
MAASESRIATEEANAYDFEHDVGCGLVQTARAYRKALEDELVPYGITFRQAQVLCWLCLTRDLSQCQLAKVLMIEPATLAGVLERMERNGLLSRLTDPSDHRRKIIRLNHRAEELCDAVAECATRVHARAAQGLGPGQLDVLRELLKRIRDNVDSQSGER